MAMQIRNAFEEKGIKMLFDSKTNQQFPILPNKMMEKLAEKYAFSFWCKVGDAHTAVRFCTSWATKEENVAIPKPLQGAFMRAFIQAGLHPCPSGNRRICSAVRT